MPKNGKFAFAFSGIEPDIDEYAIAFYHRHKSIFDSYLHTASNFVTKDLFKILQKNTTQSTDPLIAQILTYTYGVAVNNVLQNQNIRPTIVAGFSLGVYAALVGAKVVSFEDGLKMVKKAYELMSNLSNQGEFGMSAVVGLSEQDIDNIISEENLNSIERANTLNETCSIYSGEKTELTLLHKAAETAGCLNVVALEVDIPYHHSRILKQATDEFAGFLETLEWQKSSIPVISSITQELLTDTQHIKKFIAQNLSQPINWQKVIEIITANSNQFIAECGPGLTLTRNGRFIDADVKYINVKNIQKKLNL